MDNNYMNDNSNNVVTENGNQDNINATQTTIENDKSSNQLAGDNNFSDIFQDELDKKKEVQCEIGFWLSIFSLISSFFGFFLNILVYVLTITFAVNGLKTKKHNKAVATIILTGISIVILIVYVIAYFMLKQ